MMIDWAVGLKAMPSHEISPIAANIPIEATLPKIAITDPAIITPKMEPRVMYPPAIKKKTQWESIGGIKPPGMD